MARYLWSTVVVLATLFAMQACTIEAVAIARNQFENPPSLQPRDRQRISSGHHTDSPFGSGCVGTSNLCALALSRAEDAERETLHREAPPLLWKVREDEEFQNQLELSGPSLRLKQFYQRLGGDNYDFKRHLSEAELQRLLERFEEEGEREREDKINAKPEVRREMQKLRLWHNRFRKVASDHSPPRKFAKDDGSSPRGSTYFEKRSSRQLQDRPIPSNNSHIRKRHVNEDATTSSPGETVQSENDAFHASLKRQYSRPWSPAQERSRTRSG